MKWLLPVVAVLGVLSCGLGGLAILQNLPQGGEKKETPRGDTYTVERTDYRPPPPTQDIFVDDRLEDRPQLPFDPQLVDRRRLGKRDAWLLNASSAVLKLDVPLIQPDVQEYLLVLRPSFAAAFRYDSRLLPSVNLLDGKAKQFDDGLYAALDQAYYRGLKDRLASHVQVMQRLHDKTDRDSEAAAFLAAGLELAGVQVEVKNPALKEKHLREFLANEVRSKPIGFYTWNETLQQCWKFMRFYQREFPANELAVPMTLAKALAADTTLRADYQRINDFYAKLTNPLICLSMTDLPPILPDPAAFARLCQEKKVRHKAVALFPPSMTRENVLFERLFSLGLPPDVNLMQELVRRIRSGEVDLKPRPNSGWYDHQVYALETLLLAERGEERNKLLLTKAYKKRMLEAFQALMTKRRETHANLGVSSILNGDDHVVLPDYIQPQLRVEPCPTYYLRTARAYAFLANFLEAALGRETLGQLHGLKQGGERQADLLGELHQMRQLFYGLYLISCEDIGQRPRFAADEPLDQEDCYRLAADWLENAAKDEDFAVDTRVAIPIAVDPMRGVTRLWLTLGVRLAKLDASYARPPSLKPAMGTGEWQTVESHRLQASNYLIAVDEFAEVELKCVRSLTREEFRAICDREKTKEKIIAALQK